MGDRRRPGGRPGGRRSRAGKQRQLCGDFYSDAGIEGQIGRHRYCQDSPAATVVGTAPRTVGGHRLGAYAARTAGESRLCPIAAAGRKSCCSISQVASLASRKAGSARRGSPTVARLRTPDQVLLRGPDEALGAAVPFRRAHEGRGTPGPRLPGRAPRPHYPSGVATVTPSTREIISRSSPRGSRSTRPRVRAAATSARPSPVRPPWSPRSGSAGRTAGSRPGRARRGGPPGAPVAPERPGREASVPVPRHPRPRLADPGGRGAAVMARAAAEPRPGAPTLRGAGRVRHLGPRHLPRRAHDPARPVGVVLERLLGGGGKPGRCLQNGSRRSATTRRRAAVAAGLPPESATSDTAGPPRPPALGPKRGTFRTLPDALEVAGHSASARGRSSPDPGLNATPRKRTSFAAGGWTVVTEATGTGGSRRGRWRRPPGSRAGAPRPRPPPPTSVTSSAASAGRRPEGPSAYLTLDARHGKVREAGVVGGRAVPIAVGIDREGRRRALAVEPADREGRPSREGFPPGSRERAPSEVVLVAAGEHAGPRAAPREALPDAFVQRRHARFPRDAPDHLPREADGGCRQELRRTGARPPAGQAGPPRAGRGRGGPRRPARGVGRPPRQADEPGGGEIEETFACHRPPRQRRKHTGSANMPGRSSGRGPSGARASCASSRTRRAARGRCPRWPSRPARAGRERAVTRPWTTSGGRSPGSAGPRDRACRPQGRHICTTRRT